MRGKVLDERRERLQDSEEEGLHFHRIPTSAVAESSTLATYSEQ